MIKKVLIIFVISTLGSVWLLRQNNLHMVHLRDEALVLDEMGDAAGAASKIEELGNHVLNHMNTNMGGPLDLPVLYNTAVEEIRREVELSGSANSSVYAQAQQVCEDPNVLLQVRAQCYQDYVTANARPGTPVQELVFPDKALYSYSFASPLWSADAAGLSVLVAALSFILFAGLIVGRYVVPLLNRWIDSDPLE